MYRPCIEKQMAVQENLNNIVEWYQKNYIKFNIEKTKYIYIHFTNKTRHCVSKYKIDNIYVQ